MYKYVVGIDISKYKHDCCIKDILSQKVEAKFTIKNDKDGFDYLLTCLTSFGGPEEVKIGFESTAHYGLNLMLFLEKNHHSFMEVNPYLIKEFKMAHTLRRTKTDAMDCELIADWLMSVEYKPHSKGFYHAYSLKSLTRMRDTLIKQRSLYKVKITNVLDHTFPEYKQFFSNTLSKTALYILKNYISADNIAELTNEDYETIKSVSRGHFSPQHFMELKSLAANSIGTNNTIFELELKSFLSLFESIDSEIEKIEEEITKLLDDVNPHFMTIPGIGPISAAVIYSEYGGVDNFTTPSKMLAFAGMEPSVNESGIETKDGRMVKHGSSQLRYTLMNCCIPLIRHDVVFATYYAKKRAEGKPHRVALVHVAKKLIRVIYTLEAKQEDFNSMKLR